MSLFLFYGVRQSSIFSRSRHPQRIKRSPQCKPFRQRVRQTMKNVMAVVLAGGKGSRLEPLTRDRAKPAVPFGGGYRIVDFALSNCLNSGLRKLILLTQYKAMSLDRHVNNGWRRYFCSEMGDFIDVMPPQQRIDENWYKGTADAVYQNIYAIEKERWLAITSTRWTTKR